MRLNAALGKSTLESKGDDALERRCKPFPKWPDFCMTRNSSAERTGTIVLIGCPDFYAGGARLGPGARGTPPSASTFSFARAASTTSGVISETAWNKDVGADARGTARTMRRCDTRRRSPAGNGFTPNAAESVYLTAAHGSAALARVPPPVMHSAYSPKRTATSESREMTEFRRTMTVPAGSCT